MSKYISVGKILNFHGIKGEIKVGYSKNQRDFLLNLDKVFINIDNVYKEFIISYVKQHKNILIVKFKGFDSINEVIPLKGLLLFVEENFIRSSLGEDEFLIDELVGLGIYDSETQVNLGFVVGVSNNGANDLISVKTKSNKICLIPFVKAIVPTIDIEGKKIFINNIEGLLE